MVDVVLKRCYNSLPKADIRDGKCFIHCPICGKEMYLFPTGVLQQTSFPNARYVPREIAEAAANRWNEPFANKEEVNGR